MAGKSVITLEKRRRFMLIVASLAGILSLLILAIFMFSEPESPESKAKIAKPRADEISGYAGGKGSTEYNEKLQKHDEQKANEALKAGQSFIPTPVGNKQPSVVRKEAVPPPAAPKVAPVKTAPARVPQADNSLMKRMLEDLAVLNGKLSAVAMETGKIIYEKDFSKDTLKASARANPPVAQQFKVTSVPALKPGDLLYAVIDTGVNSDVPSAVMATVAQGKYRNSRLLGSFQRHEERLVLAFSRIVMPDGSTNQLEAYAVDPGTSEASVASSVDTHFFSRWGGLVASAFLEGLGTAKRYSGASSTIYGYGNNSTDQMVWNRYSPEDQAWIAAGKVGEKASKIFDKQFDRPPTVYLESGSSIGVLILNVKEK